MDDIPLASDQVALTLVRHGELALSVKALATIRRKRIFMQPTTCQQILAELIAQERWYEADGMLSHFTWLSSYPYVVICGLVHACTALFVVSSTDERREYTIRL